MIIYLLIALFATVIGAAAGLGGGVIIKPLLDLIGDYNIVTISILSSVTVLSMAIVSTIRQVRNGFKITREVITITVGAVFGGILGSVIFAQVSPVFKPSHITIAQSLIIIFLLMLCIFFNDLPRLKIKSIIIECLVGLMLGMFSSFLGIGGGPINVAVLYIIIGLELKNSTKISVFIILFSQISGLVSKAIEGMFSQVEDFSMLLVMIPAAIAGGIIGSQLNIKLSDKSIGILYKSTVILVIIICVYNIFVLV